MGISGVISTDGEPLQLHRCRDFPIPTPTLPLPIFVSETSVSILKLELDKTLKPTINWSDRCRKRFYFYYKKTLIDFIVFSRLQKYGIHIDNQRQFTPVIILYRVLSYCIKTVYTHIYISLSPK